MTHRNNPVHLHVPTATAALNSSHPLDAARVAAVHFCGVSTDHTSTRARTLRCGREADPISRGESGSAHRSPSSSHGLGGAEVLTASSWTIIEFVDDDVELLLSSTAEVGCL